MIQPRILPRVASIPPALILLDSTTRFIVGADVMIATPMRRLLFAALLLLPSTVAFAQGAPGGGRNAPQAPLRELLVANRASQPVRELYASPSTIDDWGEDRLGADTLAPGKVFRLRLGRSRDCVWDLQVVYGDGSTEENRNVNLCRNRQVSFDGSAAVPADRGPNRSLALQNATSARIDQVFISPSDTDRWNDDRLPGLLEPGESGTVEYRGPCEVDIRIVFATRAAEERRGLDACRLQRLVIAPGWTLASDPSVAPAPPTPPAGAATSTASPNRVAVRNDAGRTIVELYLYPDRGERGDDRLGMSVLDPGQERQIPVALDQACDYTVRAVLSGAGAADVQRTGLDLCRDRALTVTADGVSASRPETAPPAQQ